MSATGTRGPDTVSISLVDGRPGDWRSRLQDLHEVWPKAPDAPQLESSGAGRIYFTRWSSRSTAKQVEFVAESGSRDHLIFLALRAWDITYRIGPRTKIDKVVAAGDIALRGPDTTRSNAIYRGNFDVFRMVLPNELIVEGVEAVGRRHSSAEPVLFGSCALQDPTIHRLSLSLLIASNGGVPLDAIYVDSVGLALATYIARKYDGGTTADLRPLSQPLSTRRLKRVVEYIDANLMYDMTLAELGTLSGLSRMYFAAQFRAATGDSPHAFIVKRRLAMARSLLIDPLLPISGIARAVGFRSHGHFIRSFRQHFGITPSGWRASMLE